MKTITPALQSHLAQSTTTLATMWRVQRTDGAVFTFTDFNEPITYLGEVYTPSSGFTHSAIDTSDGLNVDNLEVDSVLTSETITDADLLAGVWDFASVEIFQVNYLALADGGMTLRTGKLGEVKTGRNNFTAELRGLAQPLQQAIGRVFGPACDANLGDSRCTKDLTSFTTAGTVTSVTDQAHFTSSALAQATGYFDYGLITFTSGLNIGRSMEVRSFTSGGTFVLQMPLPYAVGIGDTFTAKAGCDKLLATCISRFSNAVNFRGFPNIPGSDRLATGE